MRTYLPAPKALLPHSLTVDVNHWENPNISQLELRRLLFRIQSQNHVHYLIFKFLVCTGFSIPELIAIKVKDFDPEKALVSVPERDRLKRRSISLATEFSREIYRYCLDFPPDSYLFPGREEGQRQGRSVQKILQKASGLIRKEVNIPFLRDTIALHLFRKGFPIWEIQEFLGHRSPRSTRRRIYLQISPDEQRDPRLFKKNKNQAA
ncbi:site-specific integrase [Leptospira sp. 96542]|nr:site-specific integrase [Leptospira sp. 96542]